jgi:hypothetical protein
VVAERLSAGLGKFYDIDLLEIEPVRRRRYVTWLVYSFVPNSVVRIKDIRSDVSPYDLVCLGTPKWTFSCPPFNAYLRAMTGCEGKKFGLFVTYGGFREEGFITHIVGRIKQKGANSISVLAIRRSEILTGGYVRQVDGFSAGLIPSQLTG